MPPGNFKILHAVQCVLGASESPFLAVDTILSYIPGSCRLRLAVPVRC